MNIWTPLPSDTNTLYVVKLDAVPPATPLKWRPDPGTRVLIRYGSFTVTSPPFGAIRQPFWRLWYGSDVVASYLSQTAVPSGKTTRWSIGKFYFRPAALAVSVNHIYWDSSVYITHDFELELGGDSYEAADQYADGVLFIDVWRDMIVSMGD